MTRLEECVRAAAPEDEFSPVTMPDGEVVPFGRVIALTHGEALEWLEPEPVVAAGNPWHDEQGLFARRGIRPADGSVADTPVGPARQVEFTNRHGTFQPGASVQARRDGTIDTAKHGRYQGLGEDGRPIVELLSTVVPPSTPAEDRWIVADPAVVRPGKAIGAGLERYPEKEAER